MVPLSPKLDATWPEHACQALKKSGKVCPKRFSQRVLGDALPWSRWIQEQGGAAAAQRAMDDSVQLLEAMAQQRAGLDFRGLICWFWLEPLCRLYPDSAAHLLREGEKELILDIFRQGLAK